MADLPALMAQQRDKITELLASRRPDSRTMTHALTDALKTGRGYGEVLTQMRAAELAEQNDLFKVMATERGMQQADRQIALQEQTLAWNKIQSHATWAAEAIKTMIEDPESQARVAAELPDTTNENNVWRTVAQTARKLGVKYNRAKYATGTPGSVIYDENTGKVVSKLPGTPSGSMTQLAKLHAYRTGLEQQLMEAQADPKQEYAIKELTRRIKDVDDEIAGSESVGKLMAPILKKVIQQGRGALTASEQQAWDMFKSVSAFEQIMNGYTAGAPDASQPSGAPAVMPEGIGEAEAQAWFDALPPGTVFVNPADGQLMRKTQ